MNTTPPPHRSSFVWPILFIGAGVYFLLVNLGYISPLSWAILVRFWPVLLIVIGLDILFGRRSLAGGLASSLLALLLVGGLIWVLMQNPERFKSVEWMQFLNPTMKTEKIDVPLESIKDAEISLDLGSGVQTINALPATSASMLEGKIDYYGMLNYTVEGSGEHRSISLSTRNTPDDWFILNWQPINWRISLHPDVVYSLYVDTGSGRNKFDLSALKIKELHLGSGSGRIYMNLPAGDYYAKLDIGSGQTEIHFPAHVAAQVRLDQGSGRFRAPDFKLIEGEKDEDGVWETPAYASASQRIEMDIDQGSGDILLKSD